MKVTKNLLVFVVLAVQAAGGALSCTTQADLGHRPDYSADPNNSAIDASSDVHHDGQPFDVASSELAPDQSPDSRDATLVVDSQKTSPVSTCWAKGFGSIHWDVGNAVDVGEDGYVYVAGSGTGAIDFGGGALAVGETAKAVLASFTPSGAHRWSKGFGDNARALDVTVGKTGDIYVIGTFLGSVDFGGETHTSNGTNGATFLASFASDGTYRWSKSFGETSYSHMYDRGRRVGLDANGNVYLTTQFQGSTNLGGSTLSTTGPNDRDVLLASFTSDGAHRWSQRHGGLGQDIPGGLGVDGNGNVYIAGKYSDTADFGGGLLSAALRRIFVASYSSTGVHRWSNAWGGGNATANDLDVDKDGNVFITGEFGTKADFGGPPLTATGALNLYVASFDSSGAHRWSKGFDVSGWDDDSLGVEVGHEGTVYITGACGCLNLDFGGGTLGGSNGLRDIYIASFTSMGQYRWAKTYGGGINDWGNSLAVSPKDDRIFATGLFEYSVDFGQGPVVSSGDFDLFLLCLHE